MVTGSQTRTVRIRLLRPHGRAFRPFPSNAASITHGQGQREFDVLVWLPDIVIRCSGCPTYDNSTTNTSRIWLWDLTQGGTGASVPTNREERPFHLPTIRLQSLMGRSKENLTCWFGFPIVHAVLGLSKIQ